jgi:hypothetical protein
VINDYAKFVDTTTSEASKNTYFLTNRLDRLCGTTGHKGEDRWEEIQVARLLTAVVGMMAESGEFAEVVKKKSISSRYTVHRRRNFPYEKRAW